MMALTLANPAKGGGKTKSWSCAPGWGGAGFAGKRANLEPGEPSPNCYVCSMPAALNEEDIQAMFSEYATVSSVKVVSKPGDRLTAALVKFATQVEAAAIIETFNGQTPDGWEQPIEVRYANNKGGYNWNNDSWGASSGGSGGSGGGSWGGSGGASSGASWGGGKWSGYLVPAKKEGKGAGGGGDDGDNSGGSWSGGGGSWSGGGGGGAPVGGDNAWGAKYTPLSTGSRDTVYVSSLPEGIEDHMVKEMFGGDANVTKVKMVSKPDAKFSAALVTFKEEASAKEVVETVNGQQPDGFPSPIHVKFAFDYSTPDHRWSPYGAKGNDWNNGKGGGGGGKGKGDGKGTMDELVQLIIGTGALPGVNTRGNGDATELFVSGLPQDCTELHLYHFLSPFGNITPRGIKVMRGDDGGCKGFAFVNMINYEQAMTCIETLDGAQMPTGRTLQVRLKEKR